MKQLAENVLKGNCFLVCCFILFWHPCIVSLKTILVPRLCDNVYNMTQGLNVEPSVGEQRFLRAQRTVCGQFLSVEMMPRRAPAQLRAPCRLLVMMANNHHHHQLTHFQIIAGGYNLVLSFLISNWNFVRLQVLAGLRSCTSPRIL